jgi:hypothetical protein
MRAGFVRVRTAVLLELGAVVILEVLMDVLYVKG